VHITLGLGAPDKSGVNYDLTNFKVLVTPKLFYDELSFSAQANIDSEIVIKKGCSTKLMEKSSILVSRQEIKDEVLQIIDDPFYKSFMVLNMFKI